MIQISNEEIKGMMAALRREFRHALPFECDCDMEENMEKPLEHPHIFSNWFECDTNSFSKNVWMHYECGATKIVLFPKRGNYVVKIPYYSDEFRYVDGKKGDSRRSPSGWDYCALEEYNYARAVDFGIEEFFLETREIGRINDCPIYVQEKATETHPAKQLSQFRDEWEENNPDASFDDWYYDGGGRQSLYKTINTSCNRCFDWGRLNPFFILEILEKYGVDTIIRIKEFINKYDICDLHDSNVGYLNGHPVFFDYSGV